jgi:peroxiredoxin
LTSNNENLHLEHQLSGSKDNELLNTYQSYYNTLYYGQEALKTLSPEQQKPKEQELSKFYFEKNKEVQETVQKNPKALANIMALSLLHPLQNTDVAQIVLNNLKANYPYSKPVNLAFNELNKQLPVEVGMMAPEIKLENPEGKLISSKDYLGKVVLLDFWASWCMPCRMENPNVVKAYQKYHDKGFEILGVSLDNNKDKWVQAIAKDQLTWNHISDLKGWGSSATQIFKFSSIPLTILIGKDGKILAKNLRGPALEEKLEELFGK